VNMIRFQLQDGHLSNIICSPSLAGHNKASS